MRKRSPICVSPGGAPIACALVEEYTKEQGLFRTDATPDPIYTDTLDLDLATVEATLAGPKRPQDRVPLQQAKARSKSRWQGTAQNKSRVRNNGDKFELSNGSVVIAAITSCTNTSNPSLMLGAGLLAKKAVERGLQSEAVGEDEPRAGIEGGHRLSEAAGLWPYLESAPISIWWATAAPLASATADRWRNTIGAAIKENSLVAVSVLSGNRNFEGRIHPLVRANYLASPPLVVAYALAGRMDFDMVNEPLATDKTGKPVFLRDIWPTPQEIESTVRALVTTAMYPKEYGEVFHGRCTLAGACPSRKAIFMPGTRNPPTSSILRSFDRHSEDPAAAHGHPQTRACWPCSATASPRITFLRPDRFSVDSPAGKYLIEQGVKACGFQFLRRAARQS